MVQVALISILVCDTAALAQTPYLQGGVQENSSAPPPPSPPQTPMQSGGAEQNQLAPPPDLPGAHWVARDQDMGPCNGQNYANNALFAKLIRPSGQRAVADFCRNVTVIGRAACQCWVAVSEPRNGGPNSGTPNGTDATWDPTAPGGPEGPTVEPPYVPPVPGGYDPCANANAWRIPQCQSAAVPSPAPPPQQGPCKNVPDPATQQVVRRMGIEWLDTFAAMGSQADNLLTHFSRATLAQINLLQHPDQFAAGVQKTANDVVVFLANQDPAKFTRLRDQALNDFRRDPSGALGDLGANAFTGELIGGACSVSAAGAKALAAKVAMTQRATGSLRKIVGDMKRADGNGDFACAPLIAKAGDPELTNPFWDQHNCVPSVIAGALREFDRKPWTAVDIVSRYPRGAEVMDALNAGKGLKAPLMYDMMRYYFGTVVPKGLSVERLLDQLFGLPTSMSRRAIEAELLQAGPGSGGLVTVRFMQDGVEQQHVFRASNQGGVVKYVDNQSNLEGSYNFIGAIDIGFWRYR